MNKRIAVAIAALWCGAVEARAQDIVVRATEPASPQAERLLAEVAEPTLLRVEANDNPIEAARLACGRLSATYLQLFAEANEPGAFAIRAAPRYLTLPACFVAPLDQIRVVLPQETARDFLMRNVGSDALATLRRLLQHNRTSLWASGAETADLTSFAISPLPANAALHLDYASVPTVYQLRRDVSARADGALAELNATLPGAAAPSDELQLESDIPPGVALTGNCVPPSHPHAWPLSVSDINAALARVRAIRLAQHLGDQSNATIAIVDNGLDGLISSAFPVDAFAINGGERASDGADNDGNGYPDDLIGANMFDRREPVAFPALRNYEHGTHIAGLAIGSVDLRASQPAASPLPVRLLIISLVRRDVTVDGVNYAMPTEGLTNAIEYAEQRGARIMNLSVSTQQNLRPWIDRVRASRNMLLVVAAGNGSTDYRREARYPALFGGAEGYARDQVVTVAAHDQHLCLSPFSGHDPAAVDLAAPGVGLLSYGHGGSVISMDGTSQATALVSLTAALLSADGLQAPSAIKYRLWASVDLTPGLYRAVASDGALNIVKAISRHHDVIELDNENNLIFGQLDTPLDFATWCPSLAAEDAPRIMKISRRVDGGPPQALRLLVRWPNGRVEALHCAPAISEINFRREDGSAASAPLSHLIDLVPRD